MNKALGVVLVALGAIALFKMIFSGPVLLLLLAVALAYGAANGSIGKWGYAVAALLAIPSLLGVVFRLIGLTLGLTFGLLGTAMRFAPVLLILVGIYVLVRSFSR